MPGGGAVGRVRGAGAARWSGALKAPRLLIFGAVLLFATPSVADPAGANGSAGSQKQAPPPSAAAPRRVDHVGSARWSPTLGFVQTSGNASGSQSSKAKSAVIQVPPGTPGASASSTPSAGAAASKADPGLDMAVFQLGLGSLYLAQKYTYPGDFGVLRQGSYAGTALQIFVGLRYAERPPDHLVGFWLDWRLGGAIRSDLQVALTEFDAGFDIHPVPQFRNIGIGPLVGLSLDALGTGGYSPEARPQFVVGGRLHFVWGKKENPLLYVDPSLTLHKGGQYTAQYLAFEAGFRLGESTYLWARWDQRLGSSGKAGLGDDPIAMEAETMPVKTSLLAGIGFAL